MELRQLQYFVAVAEEGSFTRAAGQQHVAQPAVSAQIRRLERLVGQPLFERSTRDVRLTQAGAALLPYARDALAAVTAGQAAVDDVGNLVRGSVSVGTVTLHPVDLAGVMADFHADFPAVQMTLSADSSDVLVDQLIAGRLDIAIVSLGIREWPPGLDLAVITDEVIEAVVSAQHPLSRRKVLSLSQLCEHPLISLPVGTGLRSRLDAAAKGVGVHPRVAFEATNPLELVELARHGLGVAIVPQSMARNSIGLHPLRLDPELRGRLVWAWRRDMSGPAARRFCERAVNAAAVR